MSIFAGQPEVITVVRRRSRVCWRMLAPQRRRWSQVSACLMSVRMKLLVGCLKAETQWKYFVSLAEPGEWLDAVSPWRHGKARLASLRAWCGSMPCRSEKVSNALFYGRLRFNRRDTKKPHWFPPQTSDRNQRGEAGMFPAIRRSCADRRSHPPERSRLA